MLSLRLFGGLSLSNPGNTIPARANQRRRLALLAILGVSSGKPVSRDKLAALLWPDADTEHARHLLSDSLYVLRSALGDDLLVVSGENVSINLELMRVDVAEFSRAIERGDSRTAVEIRNGGGPFLDGVHLPDSPEFERWVDSVRIDLTAAYHDALKQLARACSAAGDRQGAVTWWRRVAAEDPLSSSVALELMRALEAAGDRGAALAFARVYENLVRSELDSPPDPSITAFVEGLRNGAGDSRTSTPAAITSVPTKSESPPDLAPLPLHSDSPASGSRRRQRLLTLGCVGALLVLTGAGLYAVWRTYPERQRTDTSGPASFASDDYILRHRTTNRTAYDFYLRGRQHRELRDPAGFHAAIKDYRAAIELDSNYAEAYAGLSEAYTLLLVAAEYDKDPPLETARKAEAAALKAIALADSLGEAHMALGVAVLHGPPNFAKAERELMLARTLDRSDPRTPEYLIALHCWTGRQDQALTEARAIVAADPMSLGARRELGRALYTSRHYDDALVEFDRMRTVGVTPVRMAPVMAAETFDALGLYSNALAELAGKPSHYVRALAGYTLARMGNHEAADSVLLDLKEHWSRGRGGAFEVAVVYAGMRNFKAAFDWLAKSFEDRSIRSEIMDPLFDDLHADPRFAAVRKRLGLPPQPAPTRNPPDHSALTASSVVKPR